MSLNTNVTKLKIIVARIIRRHKIPNNVGVRETSENILWKNKTATTNPEHMRINNTVRSTLNGLQIVESSKSPENPVNSTDNVDAPF